MKSVPEIRIELRRRRDDAKRAGSSFTGPPAAAVAIAKVTQELLDWMEGDAGALCPKCGNPSGCDSPDCGCECHRET